MLFQTIVLEFYSQYGQISVFSTHIGSAEQEIVIFDNESQSLISCNGIERMKYIYIEST